MKRALHHIALLAVILLALPGSSAAQEAGAFARRGFGADGVATGNALVAGAGASPGYNPASITPCRTINTRGSNVVVSLFFSSSFSSSLVSTPAAVFASANK